MPSSHPPPAVAVAASLGTRSEAAQFALGCFSLCALVFITGAAPNLLPAVYLLFAAVALPWRVLTFVRRKWAPFLVDFCYIVNAATLYLLLFAPNPPSPHAEALLYVLAEGPLACALAVWRCAWLLGSADHTVSVMIHLLPGLALYSRRFLPAASGGAAGALTATPSHDPQYVQGAWLWLFVAPVAFYCCWQFLYWLLIQVVFRSAIRRNGYDTSYNALARRADAGKGAGGGVLETWVRRGSTARRIISYGLVQLGFTVIAIILAVPTYYSFRLATVWQVAKFAVPLWYGAQDQCLKLPKVAFLMGVETLAAQGLLSRELLLGVPPPLALAAVAVLSE